MIRYKNKLFFLVGVVVSNFVLIGFSSEIQLDKDFTQAIATDEKREQFLDEQVVKNPYLDRGFYLLHNRNLLNIDISKSSKSPLYNYFDKHVSHNIDDDAELEEVNFGDIHCKALDLVIESLKKPFLQDFYKYIQDPNSVNDTSIIEYVMDENNRVIVPSVLKEFVNTPVENNDYGLLSHLFVDFLLHNAIRIGNQHIFERLLDVGADVNLRKLHHETPLMAAVKINNIPMAKKLLSCGAYICHPNDKFANALLELQSAEMVQVFLDDNTLKNPENQIGSKRKRAKQNKDFDNALKGPYQSIENPLYRAIRRQNVDVVESLLTKTKTKIQSCLYKNREAWNSSKNNTKMVAVLLKHGFDKNLKSAAKETLFFQACKDSNIPMMRFLQSVGCRYIDQEKDESGKPSIWPLGYAVKNGNQEIVRELMMYNKNYGVSLDYLIKCLENGYESELDHNILDEISYRLVDQFIQAEDMHVVQKILALNKINWDKLVHVAAMENNIEVVKVLVQEKKVAINVVDSHNCTLLHHAVAKNNSYLTSFLLQAGIDIDIENEFDVSAQQLAKNLYIRNLINNEERRRSIKNK